MASGVQGQAVAVLNERYADLKASSVDVSVSSEADGPNCTMSLL
jgi:hypothetical protein